MIRDAQAASAPIPPLGWLRIAWRVAALTLALVFHAACHLGWRVFFRHSPWPRLFLRLVSRIIGLRITRRGEPVGKGAFLIANHVSWLDIPALGGLTGTAFVAQDGLADHPVLHWLCRLNDTVFIARHDRASVARQVEQVRQALRETGALTIFPEGTTHDGRHVHGFKSSLLSALSPMPAGIRVQPVWLDYGPRSAEIAWVGQEPGLANFLRIAARGESIALVVHFLPALSGEALANRKTIATNAREAIIRAKAQAEEQRGFATVA